MKTIIAAFALAIASPAFAQGAPQAPAQSGHAGHQPGEHAPGQHAPGQHPGHHPGTPMGQHQGHGENGCCADRDNDGRMDCCQQMAQSGERRGCCAEGASRTAPQAPAHQGH